MPPANSQLYVELQKELDSYKDSVSFLLALIHELCWDEATGDVREDATHEHGAKQPSGSRDPVTPDLALTIGECGVLGDVKISFADSGERRKKAAAQLLKYDDAVSEWIEPPKKGKKAKAKHACTVLLTHYIWQAKAADYFDEARAAGRFTPKHPFAIVTAVRQAQANTEEFITLHRSYGSLLPQAKDAKLAKIVSVRLDHLTTRYAVKFYDATPPLVYLLQVIWDAILPVQIPEEDFRPQGPDRVGAGPVAEVSAAEVAEQLRDQYSMRLLNGALPASPRINVARQALDLMVKWNLGARNDAGVYRFQYRKLRGGTLEYFLRKLAARKPIKARRTRSKKQLPLFGGEPKSISALDSDEGDS